MRIHTLAFFAALIVYTSYSYAALSCTIESSAPSGGEITILKLYSRQNTHASLNDPNANFYLNCRATGGETLYNTATGNYIELLRLSSASNAHVQQAAVNTYPVTAYLGASDDIIQCTYASSCTGYDTCLVSMSSSNNAHIAECNFFPINICCRTAAVADTTPPTVDVSYSPTDIGSLTVVTYTATASDAKGLRNLRVYVDGIMKRECASSPCTYSEGPYSAGALHAVFATAEDTSGNTGTSTTKSFVVCRLDDAIVSFSGGARPGDRVTINANYHGACPSLAYIQVDASDTDCRIEAVGADMVGIQGTCASSPCTTFWTVPQVPLKCQGQTMRATFAGLYKNNYPPAGERFDGIIASGSFSFYSDASNTLSVSLSMSKPTPNRGDVTTGELSCYASNPSGDRVDCSNYNTIITSISIDGRDFIAMEQWNQNLYYNSTSKGWDIPFDTSRYGSVVSAGVTFVPLGLSGSASSGFTVNQPPEISDVTLDKTTVTAGDTLTFSASITDPDSPAVSRGIDKAKVCRTVVPTDCGIEYCTMSNVGGSTYRCSYNTSTLPAGTFNFYIFANDTLGAWNITLSSQTFDVTYNAIETDIEFIDVTERLVPTTSPEPNYTRSMNINFLIRATLRNLTTGATKKCTPDICNAFYDINGNSWKSLQWDAFSAAWRASPSTSDLACDAYHNLNVRTESTNPAGLTSISTYRFFVNCVPRVTVAPVEKRLVLGDSAITVFNITIWNPIDTTTFTMEMRPQRQDGLPLPWVDYICGGNCTPTVNPNIVQVDISKISSYSVGLFMQTAARTGTYPITFAASTATGEYKATGTIQIFSEGLGEFAAWQLAALLLAAVAVWFWIKPKGLKKRGRQGRKQKRSRRTKRKTKRG